MIKIKKKKKLLSFGVQKILIHHIIPSSLFCNRIRLNW